MSKLNQIQRTLKEIDGAKFQQLCDMYLHHRGYERLNPIGLVTGTDKVVQGTPDSLVTLSNGKFVFVEYTTQQKNVCAKFLSDLGKCFNEKKTGIPVVNIQEIILCHNSVLSPAEENELMQMCQQHGCLLSIFGIGPLSYDLYQKYPGLARDFLGIHVDTGQIVKLREFITVYNKGFFATPLDTVFHFRDAEIEQILKALETTDLIVLAGRAGVGKTRLALECCERFAVANPEYQVFCIYN